MLKNILICFGLILTFNHLSADPAPISCSPQLQKCLRAIQKIPEAQVLIENIQKEGPIRIVVDQTSIARQFGALWNPEERVIIVNLNSHRSEGEVLASILFELHNASINSQIHRLDEMAAAGRISKDKYVESMEKLEWQNSINASNIADKGIQEGIFPTSAKLRTYSSFDEHFRIQKIGGHSAWIARNYDSLAPRRTAMN